VDFDLAMKRSAMYKSFERESHEHVCNLLKQGEKSNG
jgi:hypothetical protein